MGWGLDLRFLGNEDATFRLPSSAYDSGTAFRQIVGAQTGPRRMIPPFRKGGKGGFGEPEGDLGAACAEIPPAPPLPKGGSASDQLGLAGAAVPAVLAGWQDWAKCFTSSLSDLASRNARTRKLRTPPDIA
jgi:hypothetical protein